MSNLLVTGRWGEPHVTSAQQRNFNAGAVGPGCYVMSGLEATMDDANTCTVSPGVACFNGADVEVPAGGESVTIDNGTQGQMRNDLVVLRYEIDPSEQTESVSLVAVKGTPAASNPQDPAVNEGSILDGDSPVDMPLYRIQLDGVSVGDPQLVAETVGGISELGARPRVFAGSKSLQWEWSGVACDLFSEPEFIAVAGRAFDPDTDYVGVMNGAWDANGVRTCGTVYNPSTKIVYAVFVDQPEAHTWVRINYAIVLGE